MEDSNAIFGVEYVINSWTRTVSSSDFCLKIENFALFSARLNWLAICIFFRQDWQVWQFLFFSSFHFRWSVPLSKLISYDWWFQFCSLSQLWILLRKPEFCSKGCQFQHGVALSHKFIDQITKMFECDNILFKNLKRNNKNIIKRPVTWSSTIFIWHF